jgi:glycosyltransferase involved in cell wall biosynthesis
VAPNKGLDCLVAAVRLLRDRGTTLAVKVFGSGDLAYVNELKAKIAEANLTEIWNWMGYEWDKAKIFGSMDICVVPSCFGDPFPTVAMEAGVYGLPVVASHIGGLPEIIEDGVTGWLVEPNSPAPMAEKIQWLIEHPDRGRAMGAAGRAKVFQQFTVEKMVAEFETLFKAVTVRTH